MEEPIWRIPAAERADSGRTGGAGRSGEHLRSNVSDPSSGRYSRNSYRPAPGDQLHNPRPSDRDEDADDRVTMPRAQSRKIGRRIVLTVFAISLLGITSNLAEGFAHRNNPHVQLVTQPPRIITQTRTVTKTVQAKLPQVCVDYAKQLDAAAQGVYDYEHAVSPESDILSQGLQAMIDQSPNELNRVRTAQTQLESDSGAPLNSIVSNMSVLKNLSAQCQRAIGGN